MVVDKSRLKLIPNSQDQTCFACGCQNPDGLQMEFYTDNEQLYSFHELPAKMAGWDKTIHGGIVSTVLDEIMGWGVIYLCKKIGVTQKITVEFVKPVLAEDQLIVIGRLEEKQSARSVIMSAEVYNSESVKCAHAVAEFKALEPKTAMRLGIVSEEYMRMFQPVLEFCYDD